MDGALFIWVRITERRGVDFVGTYNGQDYEFTVGSGVYVARAAGNDWLAFLWSSADDHNLKSGRDVNVRAVRLSPVQRMGYCIDTLRDLAAFLHQVYELDLWKQR